MNLLNRKTQFQSNKLFEQEINTEYELRNERMLLDILKFRGLILNEKTVHNNDP